MITGVGTDIIEIERIDQSIEKYGKKFLDRLFSPEEQSYCDKHKESARHYAGRFAAKEAVVKALGTGISEGTAWLDIEVLNDPQGKPMVLLSNALREKHGHPRIHLSISHNKSYATAFAVCEA